MVQATEIFIFPYSSVNLLCLILVSYLLFICISKKKKKKNFGDGELLNPEAFFRNYLQVILLLIGNLRPTLFLETKYG